MNWLREIWTELTADPVGTALFALMLILMFGLAALSTVFL